MSAKNLIESIVNAFRSEPMLKDKTNGMAEGLMLGATLADEANERSKETEETADLIVQNYEDQVLAQDLNANKDPELVDLRGGKATAGARITEFETNTKNRVDAVEATSLRQETTKMQANPTKPLDIETYDGSNHAQHPKVLFFQDGWKGFKYWMAFTPYPKNSRDDLENPSIMVSNDGDTWKVPVGLTNPIDLPDGVSTGDYFSDTHLVYRKDLDRLECWYREVTATTEKIWRKTTTNGTTWSARELLHTKTRASWEVAAFLLSPAVIYDEGIYKIWVIRNRKGLDYFESTTGKTWTFKHQIGVTPLEEEFVPWHFDVVKTNLGYEYIGCHQLYGQFATNNFIFHATSKDNLIYTTPKKIIGNGLEGNWDEVELYRPSITKKADGTYMIYYGAVGFNENRNGYETHIGLIRTKSMENMKLAMEVPRKEKYPYPRKPITRNLFDGSKLREGMYYKASGEFVAEDGGFGSEMIKIKPETQYVTSPRNSNVAFFRKDGTYISGIFVTDQRFVSPAASTNVYYCTMSAFHSSVRAEDTMLVEGWFLPPNHVPFRSKEVIPEAELALSEKFGDDNIDSISLDKIKGIDSKNLIDLSKVTDYYVDTTGARIFGTGSSGSGFIKAYPGKNYTANTATTITFWDESESFLGGAQSNAHTAFAVPNNPKIVKMKVSFYNVDKPTVMLSRGNAVPASYVAYGAKFTVETTYLEFI